MKQYIASKGVRLDTIVYKHYGTLEVFVQVLGKNAKLKPILSDKDIVYLPEIKIEPKKVIEW
ncbi:MAG: tail protein X [Campylobacteraceae bacterium]|jgi:phage tail protein X|nr:tail protein X [Campylobacteraceae bacterium]